MKIAISVWDDRVSPLFDSARHVLLFENGGRNKAKQELISVESLTLFQRVSLLRNWKVDLFICGGITPSILETIRNQNIETIPFICGNVEALLEALRKGEDIRRRFSMPGQFEEEATE